MIHFLILLTLNSEPSETKQAQEDSLLIYNYYKTSVKTLKETADPHQWFTLEDSLSRATACAFRRLSIYNKKEYKPAGVYDREGFGIAYYFPPPANGKRLVAFTLIDRQTKFLVSEKGKSKIPYCEKLYYDNERNLIRVEKLNPLTLEPLAVEQKNSELCAK
jgi:hypothetical protein